jgi:hypothetical protein
MKDLVFFNYFLGFEVSFDSYGYFLSQAKYTFDLLSQARLTDSKIVDNPLFLKLRATYGKLIPYATFYG